MTLGATPGRPALPHLNRRTGTAVLVKAVPTILAAAVIPAVLFVVGKHLWGLATAIVLVVVWTGSCQLGRRLAGRPWSALLTIGLIELTLRAVLSLALSSAHAFFIIPSVVTAIIGVVFVATGFTARPLLTVILGDLVPASVLDRGDRSVARLLAKASILYGAEQIMIAAISTAMAVNLSPTMYATVHPPVSWTVLVLFLTTAGIVVRRDIRDVLRRPHLALPSTTEVMPQLLAA